MLPSRLLRTGSSSLMPSASILAAVALHVLHIEADVVEHAPRVRACFVSALAKRSWPPGTSTTGALLRVPALPPKVFAYQADRLWNLRLPAGRDGRAHAGSASIASCPPGSQCARHPASRRKPDRAGCCCRAARQLPRPSTWHLFLHVVDDEADMVDHRTLGAAVASLGPKGQIDIDAGNIMSGAPPGIEQFAAHAEENLLVRFRVFRSDVPMAHGQTELVERRRLRHRAPAVSVDANIKASDIVVFMDAPPCAGFFGGRLQAKRYQGAGMWETAQVELSRLWAIWRQFLALLRRAHPARQCLVSGAKRA